MFCLNRKLFLRDWISQQLALCLKMGKTYQFSELFQKVCFEDLKRAAVCFHCRARNKLMGRALHLSTSSHTQEEDRNALTQKIYSKWQHWASYLGNDHPQTFFIRIFFFPEKEKGSIPVDQSKLHLALKLPAAVQRLELKGIQFQISQRQTTFLKPRGMYVKEDAIIQHCRRMKVPMAFFRKYYCLVTSAERDIHHYSIDLDLETRNVQPVSFPLDM